MKKKGIKKYQIGAEGLLGGGFKSAFSGGGSGMVNPGNAGLKQMTTTSSSTIPTGALPTTGNISQVANTQKVAAKGPSFGDKAGAFMGNYGGAITSAASSLMPLLMKKPDPNAKPYKKGSKLIKYQEGTQKTIVADPNDPDNLHEYFKRRSKEAKALREASEPQGEMGPTRKEVADFMRKYNAANKNNPNIIGSIDEDEFNARAQQLQDLGISEPIKKSSPPSLIPSKQASLKFTQQTLPTPKLNKVAIDKPSRRERKAENRRLEAMARAPITYNEPAFVGPINQESKKGTPFLDDIVKKSMSSEAFKKTMTPKAPIKYNRGDFNTFSDAEKKYYRKKIAEGVAFKIGDREYAAATPAEKAFSKRMEAKSKVGSGKKVTAKTDNYKPNVVYTKPESLTDITRKQILTPNKKLQEIEKSKKDFNSTLEQARLKAEKTRKPGEAGDNNNPDVIAYKKLLNQAPLSQTEQRNINNTKEAMDPTNIALRTATGVGGTLAAGAAIKYGLQYGKPLLNKIPFGSLLKYGDKEAIKEGVKQGLKKNTKNLVTSEKFGRAKGFRQNPLQNSNK